MISLAHGSILKSRCLSIRAMKTRSSSCRKSRVRPSNFWGRALELLFQTLYFLVQGSSVRITPTNVRCNASPACLTTPMILNRGLTIKTSYQRNFSDILNSKNRTSRTRKIEKQTCAYEASQIYLDSSRLHYPEVR